MLEEVEILSSTPSSPTRPVAEEDTPPPPHLPTAPRRGLLGPPSPFKNTLRAIEKSIAQQTARYFVVKFPIGMGNPTQQH